MEEYRLVASIVGLGMVISAVGTILAFCRGGKNQFTEAAKGLWRIVMWVTTPLHGPWTVTRKLEQLEERSVLRDEEIQEVKADIGLMRSELSPNGWSSMRDAMSFVLGVANQTLREIPYPLFVCDGDGRFLVVSDPLVRLLRVPNDSHLLDFDWKQFIYQEDLAALESHFRSMAATRTVFRGVARMVDYDGEVIGQWEMRAAPMLTRRDSRLLYKAVLRPLDKEADKTAQHFGFEWP